MLTDGPGGVTIGGASSDLGNVISGNQGFGIVLTGESTDNNTIQNNLIGTSADASQNIGNADTGIEVTLGSDDNQILDNIIAGSGSFGVVVSDLSLIHI